MKLFYDYKTKRRLENLITRLPETVNKIYAAIAYTQSDLLIKKCINEKIHLEWWGLFDSSSSTKYDLVEEAILSDYIKFYPFAEFFHPKVIYFENYGLYIGSANMTNNALYNNVEAGVFIEKEDLTTDKLNETIDFFNFLRESSIPATKDDIDQIKLFISSTEIERKNIENSKLNIEENFEECFKHLFLLKPGVRDYGKDSINKDKKRKLYFLQEWRETQNYLQIVKEIMIAKCIQPKWINKNTNPTIITDQLLHAYYYTYVLKGSDEGKNIEKVYDSYEQNKFNPEKAINEAINWWSSLDSAPTSEDLHINVWGPKNYKILSDIKSNDISSDDFLIVMKQNHAARNHARQIKNSFFNLPENYKTDIEERISIYSEWLYKQKSKHGLRINEVLRYVLFQENIMLEERIYNSLFNEQYHIERLGKSIIGELVGWGRPDITHLRNNRVNKALRCLGYNVKLFSE